jgi:hypothetical protein
LGWQFDRQCGDPALVKAMLAGDWDDARFVVLGPGQTFRMTADHRVIEPVTGNGSHPSSSNNGDNDKKETKDVPPSAS